MILSGQTIELLNIIMPCVSRTRWNGLTYGVGAASYDVRVEFDKDGSKERVILNPGDFILVSTMEYFTMPNSVLGIVHDKSTWVRRGLTVQNTVIDPGWEGFLTLELSNLSLDVLVLERGDPIAQIVFHHLDRPSAYPYEGKYQHQERGPVEPRER